MNHQGVVNWDRCNFLKEFIDASFQFLNIVDVENKKRERKQRLNVENKKRERKQRLKVSKNSSVYYVQ